MTETVEPTASLVCEICGKGGWKTERALKTHITWHGKKQKEADAKNEALEAQKGLPPELPQPTEVADPTQVSLPNINPVTPETPQPATPVQPLQPPVAQPPAAPVAQPLAVVPDVAEPVVEPVAEPVAQGTPSEIPQPPPMPAVQPPAVQPVVQQPQPITPVAQPAPEPQEPPAVAPPAPAVQPPAVQPPAAQPAAPLAPQSVTPPPPMTPTPELPGIPTSVNFGDVVRLVGQVWWKAHESGQWEVATANNLDAAVIQKEVVSGKTLLICRVIGGSAIWGILEEMVFQGMIKLVKRAPTNGAGLADFRPPDDLQINVSDQMKKERQDRVEYGKKLIRYANAKNEEDRAQKQFKAVSKETREGMEGYLRTYGVESDDGKGDFLVNDLGYRSHLIKVNGREVVSVDEDAIVQWLVSNGHNSALKYALNKEAYDKLKEAGIVPPEIIAQTEKVTKTDDSWRLKVSVDPHWNWDAAKDIKDEIFADDAYEIKTKK